MSLRFNIVRVFVRMNKCIYWICENSDRLTNCLHVWHSFALFFFFFIFFVFMSHLRHSWKWRTRVESLSRKERKRKQNKWQFRDGQISIREKQLGPLDCMMCLCLLVYFDTMQIWWLCVPFFDEWKRWFGIFFFFSKLFATFQHCVAHSLGFHDWSNQNLTVFKKKKKRKVSICILDDPSWISIAEIAFES